MTETTVKMDYKKAVMICLPFFALTMFWQAYDTILPQMLTYHFGLSPTVMGIVMGIDNLVALFFLPLFGTLSDKVNTRLGKRTPFILLGTIGGALSFTLLSIADSMQLAKLNQSNIAGVYATDNAAAAAMAAELRGLNVWPFVLFLVALFIGVFLMSMFRAPAIAICPDVFIRPHRSKANAVSNIMGVLAGVLFLILNLKTASLFGGYAQVMIITTVVMILCVLVYLVCFREPKEARLQQEMSKKLGLSDEETINAKTVLTPEMRKSLAFTLIMVVLMNLAYNAYTTHFSVYAIQEMGMTAASLSKPLIIRLVFVAILSIPSAILSAKIGRTLCARIGLIIAGLALGGTYFLTPETSGLISLFFIVFAVGFAMVGVNAAPMVYEVCTDADNGKFTGYYYIATSIAMIVTPAIAGIVVNNLGYKILPIYSLIFFFLAAGATLFIKCGDVKKSTKE